MDQLLKVSSAALTYEERDAVIVQCAPLVKYIAQRIAARLPSNIRLDDLINAGVTGLMDAIDKYDPQKKYKVSDLRGVQNKRSHP